MVVFLGGPFQMRRILIISFRLYVRLNIQSPLSAFLSGMHDVQRSCQSAFSRGRRRRRRFGQPATYDYYDVVVALIFHLMHRGSGRPVGRPAAFLHVLRPFYSSGRLFRMRLDAYVRTLLAREGLARARVCGQQHRRLIFLYHIFLAN